MKESKSYSLKYYEILRSFLYQHGQLVAETGELKTGKQEIYHFDESTVDLMISADKSKISPIEITVFSENEEKSGKVFKKLENQLH